MSTSNARRTAALLEPLDTLFFRDGTPFGASTRGESRMPLPQTFYGAVCTSLLEQVGCDFRRLKEQLRDGKSFRDAVQELCGAGWVADVQVRGPWFAQLQPDAPGFRVVVPAPATLHGKKKQAGKPERVHRLKPLTSERNLPGWQPPREGMRPLWLKHADVTEPLGGFLTLDGLQRFLDNKDPESDDLVLADELYGFDHRTGIGIDPDRLSAEESLIYGVSFLALRPRYTAPGDTGSGETRPETVLYAEVVLPPDREAFDPFAGVATLALGGEGRRLRVRPVAPVEWPRAVPSNGSRPMLVLTTPAPFRLGWLPELLDRPGLLGAAAVPGSVAVSGWDLARSGPKATRFAVQAGSVYFLNRQPDAEVPASLADRSEDDALQGWGCFVQGVWTHE